MKNKRRGFVGCKVLDLIDAKSDLEELIAVKTDSSKDKGVTYKEFHILPEYGMGSIIKFEMDAIGIVTNRFKLKKDLVVYNKIDDDYIQLSFLLEGEKIISLETSDVDISYENQEAYLAAMKSFKGYSRISGGKLFKEIKIKLSKAFLSMHGFAHDFLLKKISDNDIITPITDELFAILNDLENKNLKGITQKIYLKAKVFELLALQIENYKSINGNKIQVGKTVKKLYAIRQLIKNNLQKRYSSKQLAREMAMNEHILKKEFKRVFGYSINRFSAIEKMGRAKELLRNQQLPIYQIAEEVGYKNATHFTAAFKRHFGNTPKYFRNNL